MSQFRRLIGNNDLQLELHCEGADTMQDIVKLVGLDVSMDTTAVAVADAYSGEFGHLFRYNM